MSSRLVSPKCGAVGRGRAASRPWPRAGPESRPSPCITGPRTAKPPTTGGLLVMGSRAEGIGARLPLTSAVSPTHVEGGLEPAGEEPTHPSSPSGNRDSGRGAVLVDEAAQDVASAMSVSLSGATERGWSPQRSQHPSSWSPLVRRQKHAASGWLGDIRINQSMEVAVRRQGMAPPSTRTAELHVAVDGSAGEIRAPDEGLGPVTDLALGMEACGRLRGGR
jgi:hypothetical protein